MYCYLSFEYSEKYVEDRTRSTEVCQASRLMAMQKRLLTPLSLIGALFWRSAGRLLCMKCKFNSETTLCCADQVSNCVCFYVGIKDRKMTDSSGVHARHIHKKVLKKTKLMSWQVCQLCQLYPSPTQI